jgi:hypothetical protein
MGKQFTIKFQNNGKVDADALEDVITTASMQEWLLSRLQKKDILVPIDQQHMEAPESLFISLWHDAKPNGNVRHAMDRALADLLKLAWGSQPSDWIKDLLDLIAAIRPLGCMWFLISVALKNTFPDAFADNEWKRRWLLAAAAYPLRSRDQIQAWNNMLAGGEYPVIAYRALSQDLELAVRFLPQYWKSFSSSQKSFFLKTAVQTLLAHGYDRVVHTLEQRRDLFDQTPDLWEALEAVLEELGYPGALATRQTKAQLFLIRLGLPDVWEGIARKA